MNEWQVRKGGKMRLSEEALILWEILGSAHRLAWEGHIMGCLQSQDKVLLCSPRGILKKLSLNAQCGGVYRNRASGQALMDMN